MTDDSQKGRVGKYIVLFALAYGILMPAASILLSRHMRGMYLYWIIFASICLPVYKFQKDNERRLYTSEEKWKLILGTFLCTLIVDMVCSGVGILATVKPGGNFILLEFSNFIILWCIFGPLSKSLYKNNSGCN